jgi:hypothetical protein
MRKVIRGVTLKTKISISFLLARSLSLIARINALRLLVRIKDIWSDKEQRSLRRKLFVSRLLQTVELNRQRWLLRTGGERPCDCGACRSA